MHASSLAGGGVRVHGCAGKLATAAGRLRGCAPSTLVDGEGV